MQESVEFRKKGKGYLPPFVWQIAEGQGILFHDVGGNGFFPSFRGDLKNGSRLLSQIPNETSSYRTTAEQD
jgi:hypothetical protein